MTEELFFTHPILNSPYDYPSRHWELDETGQPTQKVIENRRGAKFVTPIPKPKRRRGQQENQATLGLDEGLGLSTAGQSYELTSALINDIRRHVDSWRAVADPANWRVTPETARLLQHWRSGEFHRLRPFFCQVEAAETVVWLTEVAPQLGADEKRILNQLEQASQQANPGLSRLALKLATGAGKTTVMAMLIAWQTVNAVRHPNSRRFTKGFVIVTPGITIKDRLRVLLPSGPESYYAERELVPSDMLPDLQKARVIITNYHAFMRREVLDVSRGGRALLEGRTPDEPLITTETEGAMLRRVMPELMAMKNVLVFNDEAHHCYREKPADESEEEVLKGDERKVANENREAARVWISGLEVIQRKLGLLKVFDLSATPFFLSGSGYREGTLFPWTMTDFSLMDAIECGIVKLPRVPVADNISNEEMPMFRNLWDHIGKGMPRKGRGATNLDPTALPPQLYTALEALYAHYAKTFEAWQAAGIGVPPCFIIVCNNTTTSKAVYDYVSGYIRQNPDLTEEPVAGRLELFRNHDGYGNPLPRPNTLLIDSQQLESGEALDDGFKSIAADEIEAFRRARLERGEAGGGAEPTDQEILREVMNTVGKPGLLGESVRCVVSVAMLTEGWDANTVTHVLGLRAFGTQLLCEQVVGRALRRQSYDLNEEGLFEPEYADVLGIPFDFTAKPVVSTPQSPRQTITVQAERPERDALEIEFPRIQGYRTELPNDRYTAAFTADSRMVITPQEVGATETVNSGIIGESVNLKSADLEAVRESTLEFELTAHLSRIWRDAEGRPQMHMFSQLRPIVRQWLAEYLECRGGTTRSQVLYRLLADQACEKIRDAINRTPAAQRHIVAIVDPFNPTGSTRHVRFSTSKPDRWQTDARRSHVNWVVLDSGWEAQFCAAAEQHPRVVSYVKNHGLGFEVPYVFQGKRRTYLPDFILRVDDGRGFEDLLNLVIEIKGQVTAESDAKKVTMQDYWVPGVNRLGEYGRWAFAQLDQQWEMASGLDTVISDAERGPSTPRLSPEEGAR